MVASSYNWIKKNLKYVVSKRKNYMFITITFFWNFYDIFILCKLVRNNGDRKWL